MLSEDDAVTALTKRPEAPARPARALAFFLGLSTAIGWGAAGLAYHRTTSAISAARAASEALAALERAERVAAMVAAHERIDGQSTRLRVVEHDLVECRAGASLP